MSVENRGVRIHDLVREDVLQGEWKPGDRLQPKTLAERYETSTTVVREALTRLAGEGFVRVERNRGFFVPQLSLSSLKDLTEVRCRTEELALELAIERGDLQWESDVTAAHHALSRTPRRGANDPEHVAESWALAHRAFHRRLIEACDVPVLLSLSNHLADATELYRRWAAPSEAALSRDVEAEHEAIMRAALSRDAPRAAALIREHYERTVDVVLQSGLTEQAIHAGA